MRNVAGMIDKLVGRKRERKAVLIMYRSIQYRSV